jgi:chromosome segregation ATPase
MKSPWSIALTLTCVVLVIASAAVKHVDNTRHDANLGAITDFSNRLESAQLQIATGKGAWVILSNRLDEIASTSAAFSNQLQEAGGKLARDVEQIVSLNRQVADLKSENQARQSILNQRVAELTNQLASLMEQYSLARSNLDQVNADYKLLDNRLRRDVAERLVLERKFNNPAELKQRLDYLKFYPAQVVTADSIYAGLDVEVKSNQARVIAPN